MTIVELDAIGSATRATPATGSCSTCCATGRSAARSDFHVACADVQGNVELFMQAGFAR